MFLTFYSVIITSAWVVSSLYLLVNSRKIIYLKNVSPVLDSEPWVEIIVAVKDEETEVETALKSVCKIDYKNFRIIVINDRSTDTTPAILKKISDENPTVSVITITDLPEGWLGKNHALYEGYCNSSSEWLLFTDADILYEPQALKKAINYSLNEHLDHLTALPQITSRSSIFKSIMNTFAMMLEIKLQPWNVSNPSSKAYIGIGAFNLVKRHAYEKAGTHKTISLRPDDDLKLGELIKKAGLRQGVVYGEKELSLQWYTSLSEFVKGLMKNTFSVSNYRLPTAVAFAALTFIVFVLPIPLLLLKGKSGLLMALVILLSQIILMVFKKGIQGKWWHALMIPLAGTIMTYILIKSAYKTLKQGGIYWRNTFYPLSELKKQRG